jgi:quinoprotein glucose dehydrogenase
MKRPLGTLLAAGALVFLAGALAQSNKGQATDASKEWPTYGHDSGGMRFSPLMEITPANVNRLKVAWVYHMKPAGFAAPAGRRGDGGAPLDGRGGSPPDGRGAGAPDGRGAAAVGDAPEGAQFGRGRGRGGSGFIPSENTPLVIDGTMYMSTPYSRVVAVEPTTGKEIWAFQLPSSGASTRGVEYWSGDARTPPQIVFGSSDGKLY